MYGRESAQPCGQLMGEAAHVGDGRHRQPFLILRESGTSSAPLLPRALLRLALAHELAQQQPRARAPFLLRDPAPPVSTRRQRGQRSTHLIHHVVVAVRDEPDLAEQPRLLDGEQVPRVLERVARLGHA